MRRLILALALLATPAAAQHSPAMQQEHDAFVALFLPSDATHTATDGQCSNPATWGGTLPGATSWAYVPAGVTVTCDVLRARHLRVDGAIVLPDGAQITLDSWLVHPTGSVTIGTPADPASGVAVTFTGGAINTSRDPMLLGRGLVVHGAVEIYGEPKTAWARVAADPMAGDTTITLGEVPDAWAVGDQIVIAGTHYDGHQWNGYFPPEDEVRTIAAISGATVTLDAALANNHESPRADLKTFAANLTRSVVFNSVETDPARRGHFMVMHSPGAKVGWAAFYNMGRTDKAVDAVAADPANTDPEMNVQGRYPLHLHRTGADHEAAEVVGNVVWGSPGWGIVDHDSHAVLDSNVTLNTFGAGFVAESGNERGAWTNNAAIGAMGRNWKSSKDENTAGHAINDLFRAGEGFAFRGRGLTVAGNVAASVNIGFSFEHRGKIGDGMGTPFDSTLSEFPDAFFLAPAVMPDRQPIRGFADNEAFAANAGLRIDKASQLQAHDAHTDLGPFTAWNVYSGAALGYTGHYTMRDFDVVGIGKADGIVFGTNVIDMTLISPKITGFLRGLHFHRSFTVFPPDPAHPGYAVLDPIISGNVEDLVNVDPDEIAAAPPAATLAASFGLMLWDGLNPLSVEVTGTVTDSLGDRPLPTQGDRIFIDLADFVRLIGAHGWWDTQDGHRVVLVPIPVSDRLTGAVENFTAEIEIDPAVNLNHPAYGSPVYNGTLQDAPTIEELLAQIAALEAENAALVADLNAALATVADLEARISEAVTALTGP